MSRSWHARLVVLLALAALPAAAAVPYLVADLNTVPVPGEAFSRDPSLGWTELGGFLYFAANDGQHGEELWRTNGTFQGTRMVADLCPGPCSSFPRELTVFKGRLAFNATDGVHGWEIWLSDGTREGTLMPRDFCPGSCWGVYPDFSDPVVVGDRLFFVGRQLTGGYRLGVTDGTAEGTRWLTELRGNPLSPIGEFKGRLAFLGPGTGGWYLSALWLSDGTPEGTSPAVDLCVYDEPCPSWNDASVVGDRIVFFPREQTWSSDGTAAGTWRVGDAKAATARILWKGVLYFSDFEGLWRSDGTRAGTVKLRSFPHTPPDNPYPFMPPRDFVPLGDSLFFIAAEPASGLALWRMRGNAESTEIFFDPVAGPDSPDLGPLTRAGERIVFPVVSSDSTEFWEADGSAAGTRQVTRLCGAGPIRCTGEPAPLRPTSLGQLYLFDLSDEEHGTEMWVLDGTAMRVVRDIFRQPGSGRPGGIAISEAPEESKDARDIASLGTRIVFSARTTPQGPARLWATDGTAAGTAEIGPNISWPNGLVRIGDRLWLRGSVATYSLFLYGREIWSTDGTAAGTQNVRARVEVGGFLGGRPGLILFAGQDLDLPSWDSGGLELWASNGTAGGTGLVKDIRTTFGDSVTPVRPPSSFPGLFAPLGNNVLFTAADGVTGRELWSTDGTSAGTTLTRDLRPGAAGSNPRDLVPMGSSLFFLADGGTSDGLWTVSSNGQAKRIRLLAKDQRASSLVAAGSRLFFVVDEPTTGPELWTSTGTRASTRKVVDIRPGTFGSFPQELTAVDGLLLFAADDGVHGLELWVSDGTAAGTRLLADLAPGEAASAPRSFTVAGDLVAFDADDGVHGRELWVVRKADIAGDAFPAGGR